MAVPELILAGESSFRCRFIKGSIALKPLHAISANFDIAAIESSIEMLSVRWGIVIVTNDE